MHSLLSLLVCAALILCILSPPIRLCSAAPAPARSDAGSDAGADASPEELDQSARATPAAAAPAVPIAGSPPVPVAPATPPAAAPSGAALRNDRTAHISYSSDSAEETHCTRTGECVECSAEDLSAALPECAASGIKERVHCEVLTATAAANRNATATADAAPSGTLLRSYTQFVACDDSAAALLSAGSPAGFWSFMLACALGFAASLSALRKRRRIVMQLHNRRLDRMVNS